MPCRATGTAPWPAGRRIGAGVGDKHGLGLVTAHGRARGGGHVHAAAELVHLERDRAHPLGVGSRLVEVPHVEHGLLGSEEMRAPPLGDADLAYPARIAAHGIQIVVGYEQRHGSAAPGRRRSDPRRRQLLQPLQGALVAGRDRAPVRRAGHQGLEEPSRRRRPTACPDEAVLLTVVPAVVEPYRDQERSRHDLFLLASALA